jgi:hypothetical protein
MYSLLVNVVGLIIFGAGIITLQNIANPEFNFTLANTFFYVAALLLGLFCRSLNHEISKRAKIVSLFSVVIFIAVFDTMRTYGSFESRTAVMAFLASIFYCWQIYELGKKRKSSPSKQLVYMQ